ncbi:hypothetical protein C8F01DRAFT_1248205 [Mycena amicta]|nr:hypothetical protein C8F01DRAFT_1248205 [Mycena amicta]
MSIAELPASFAFPDDFPPELLTQILLQLPYWDLVRLVPLVSKLWKYTIDTEPALRMRVFKKASLSEMYGDKDLMCILWPPRLTESSEILILHPLIAMVTYLFGEDVSDTYIYAKDELQDYDHPEPRKLPSLSAANDLATIPVVYTLSIGLKSRWDNKHFTIDLKNPNGITVLDVFDGLADGTWWTLRTDRRRWKTLSEKTSSS